MLDVIAARLSNWYSLTLLLAIGASILSLARLIQQEQTNADVQKWSKTSEGKFSFVILIFSGYYLYFQVLGLSGHDTTPFLPLLILGGSIFVVLLFVCAVTISRWIDFGSSEQ